MAHTEDIKDLKRQAEKDGWVVTLTNGGHWRWQSPRGVVFFSAQTPGDYRVIKKIKVRLRKAANGERIRR